MTRQEVKEEIRRAGLAVSVKQAMRYELGLTFTQIVGQTGVAMKNVCSHVYAKPGANVASWGSRTKGQQAQAILLAKKLVAAPLK